MVISQSFNGAGDTRTPTLLNLGVFWLWEIPLAFMLAKPLGPNGIYLAMVIAFSTHAIAAAAIFRRGHWKTKRV
jgi:Na+-driven multidrug efflux pump